MKPFENFGRTHNGHNGHGDDGRAGHNGDGFSVERRPGDIEEEIELTRARMQSTLEAIKKDLSPGQMVDQVLHSVRGGRAHDVATSAMHSVGDMVKANPLPAAVVGIGLVWLVSSNRSKSSSIRSNAPPLVSKPADDVVVQRDRNLQPRDVESEVSSFDTGASLEPPTGASRVAHAKQRVGHLASGARASVHDARSKVSGAAHGAASRAKNVARSASTKATSGALRARDATVRTYGEQPLVIGAIAIGVGALLGALLPSTRREDELLGAQRDRVKQRVDAASADMLGRVKQKVEEGAQRMHEKLDAASPTANAAVSSVPVSTVPSEPSVSAQSSQSSQSDPFASALPPTDDGDFGGP